ncbi:MAG TPA: S24/S26 family peptidase [Armatimonadota bacterium]|jgi:hypothetical protein
MKTTSRTAAPRTGHAPRIMLRIFGVVVALPLLTAGAIAVLHLAELDSPHPLVRLVVVEGRSMRPTFRAGEQLLFVRKPWKVGDVVIADVHDADSVVKRVVAERDGEVLITGDNTQGTASYMLPRDRIIATLLCRTGLRFPRAAAEETNRLNTPPSASPDSPTSAG